MKISLLIFSALLLSGCDPDPPITSKSGAVVFVRIEGCEYLKNEFVMTSGYGVVYTHKGNCNNPIHSK